MNFLWLIKAETYQRGLVLSILFNVLAKGALFLLTICIAAYFGSDIRTDIYFFIYSSMVLLSAFTNAIDTMVLVPESMRLREQEGSDAAMVFLNYFGRLYVLAGIAVSVGLYFFGTGLFGIFSKFSPADILLYRNYFLLGSGYFFFLVLTGYMNNILTSLKYFTIPMIISGINSVIVIVSIVLLHRSFNVESIFIGGLAAYTVNLLILLGVMKRIAAWDFGLIRGGIRRQVWHKIIFAKLGQLATVASSFFPLFLLSGFGSGVISVMNYGKNIADIPNTLVTAQLANVSGIQLNELFARNDRQAMNDSFVRASKLLVFLLVPVGFFLFVFATPVVQLLYQRDHFGTGSVAGTARFMQLLALTLFSIGINAMVSRIFIAVQAIRQAFYYQLLLNGLLIAAIWLCCRHYGAYGYPYGIIIMNLVNYFAMYGICKRLAPYINYAAVMKYTGWVLLVNAAIAAGLYFLMSYLPGSAWGSLVTGGFIYLALLLLFNKLFGLNPAPGLILQYLKKKFA